MQACMLHGGAARGADGSPAGATAARTLRRDNLLEPHHILVVQHLENLDLANGGNRKLSKARATGG
jgi:hypothetical protein